MKRKYHRPAVVDLDDLERNPVLSILWVVGAAQLAHEVASRRAAGAYRVESS